MVKKIKNQVYIIGGGISGLAAGFRLRQLGFPVIILEREDKVGGLAKSFDWGEFKHLDLGPHIFHTPNAKIESLWKKEFGDLFCEGKFWSQNIKGVNFDQGYPFPLSWESVSQFPKEIKEKILFEAAHLDYSKKLLASNFKEYVEGLAGPTLSRLFYTDYPYKLWNIRTDQMSVNWAPKRINITEKTMPFHAGQWSAVGKRGSGEILERLAENFIKAGGKILTKQAVIGFVKEGRAIVGLAIGGKKTITVSPEDIIISTMPINILAGYLGISSHLKFRGVKLVFVAVKKSQAIPGKHSFLYYDAPELVFHRVSEQKKFCQNGFPASKTVLVAEVAFSRGDKIDKMPDKELIKRTIKDLTKAHLIKENDVFNTKVVILPQVYPFLTKEKESELANILSRLQKYNQLYLLGNGGEFRYADLQICYVKAVDLAERLSANKLESAELIKNKGLVKFNQEVRLGKRVVSKNNQPFIIAEIGLNHNGDINIAKRLIDEAVKAGCSAVKLQLFKAASRVSREIKSNQYAEELISLEESLFDMFERLELSDKDCRELFAYAKNKKIEFFATPFDLESLKTLEALKCPFYKISSMDLVNLPLIRAVANTGKPLILSTGMATLGQIEDAVSIVREAGNENLILLHCLSSYPAAAEDMNLKIIKTLERTFGVPNGLSDHSIGLTVATVALALGARVIERHFTLDRFMEGPDHILSSDPDEMAELVRLGHLVPAILGSGEKNIVESEIETISRQKKSLYAKVDIRKGEKLFADKITIKGPGGGILPKYLDVVIGRIAKVDIEADHPIFWDSF